MSFAATLLDRTSRQPHLLIRLALPQPRPLSKAKIATELGISLRSGFRVLASPLKAMTYSGSYF
jgi:hypothetical protein